MLLSTNSMNCWLSSPLAPGWSAGVRSLSKQEFSDAPLRTHRHALVDSAWRVSLLVFVREVGENCRGEHQTGCWCVYVYFFNVDQLANVDLTSSPVSDAGEGVRSLWFHTERYPQQSSTKSTARGHRWVSRAPTSRFARSILIRVKNKDLHKCVFIATLRWCWALSSLGNEWLTDWLGFELVGYWVMMSVIWWYPSDAAL